MLHRQILADIYSGQSFLKWFALIMSLLIGLGSIFYTDQLVKEIREREKRQIDLYARTLEYLALENDSHDILFILDEIVDANTTIPVILTDEEYVPEFFLNISIPEDLDADERYEFLQRRIQVMRKEHAPIMVRLTDEQDQIYGIKYIFYENSYLLTRLKYYPYVQLGVIALFVLVIFVIFNYSRLSEQNRVWVGLAKETAHQLGTPLSALMAWMEYLKSTYPEDKNLTELDKDIERLEMITARFSSIGSAAKLEAHDLGELVVQWVDYLKLRLSTKIHFEVSAEPGLIVSINQDLFSWVMENLIKNAADAMDGAGKITVRVLAIDQKRVAIDVEDTGKGIPAGHLTKIFKAGYTSKKRGWGLGLTLVKRIVEQYHQGKIFVKSTEVGKGTIFRILLKR